VSPPKALGSLATNRLRWVTARTGCSSRRRNELELAKRPTRRPGLVVEVGVVSLVLARSVSIERYDGRVHRAKQAANNMPARTVVGIANDRPDRRKVFQQPATSVGCPQDALVGDDQGT
jgi:hypothetical protein